jgi:hypothetical protein
MKKNHKPMDKKRRDFETLFFSFFRLECDGRIDPAAPLHTRAICDSVGIQQRSSLIIRRGEEEGRKEKKKFIR